MPNFNHIRQEVRQLAEEGFSNAFDMLRKRYLQQLAEHTGRNVILYYSGWLRAKGNYMEYSVNDRDVTALMQNLHGLDTRRGLDLVLHTPGGSITATEAAIDYLKSQFGNDVRAIVPQLAMSGGTLMALSCKTIIMGAHSSLGPVDPQLRGVPCQAVLAEYEFAKEEIRQNPEAGVIWREVFAKYNPSFIWQCLKANELSRHLLERALQQNMFREKQPQNFERIVSIFWNHEQHSKVHDRHFDYSFCKKLGLQAEPMEDDRRLTELVLSLHHVLLHTFDRTNALKIVDNNQDKHHNPGYYEYLDLSQKPMELPHGLMLPVDGSPVTPMGRTAFGW